MDEFHIYGSPGYDIDFSKQVIEFLSVTPFAHHRGNWKLEEGKMVAESDVDCASFTGHYYMRDAVISAGLKPAWGYHHALIFRALGTQKYYQAGFAGKGKVALQIQDFGLETLKIVDYDWKLGESYAFEVEVRGVEIKFSINGEKVLEYTDERFAHGMLGFALTEAGKCEYEYVEVRT